jgi:hypothetical protein
MTAKALFGRFGGVFAVTSSAVYILQNDAAGHGHDLDLNQSACLVFWIALWITSGMALGAKLHPMTVRIPSLILATAYAIWGVLVCYLVHRADDFFKDMIPRDCLPGLSRAVLSFGQSGWLFLAYACSGFLLAKDAGPRSRLINALFSVLLAGLFATTFYAVGMPTATFMRSVGPKVSVVITN